MWNWIKAHKNALLNGLLLAAPVVAGVVSGGVFTLPVLLTASAGLVGKLAASPLNHAGTVEHAMATAAQVAAVLAARDAAGSSGPGPGNLPPGAGAP